MSGLNGNLQLLERAIAILDYLSSSERACTLKEIVNSTGISKPSVHRILTTLSNNLVLVKDAHSQYRMGPRAIQWSRACRGQSDLLKVALPYIDKIWDITGETLHLVNYENGYAYYLFKKESRHPLQMRSRSGDPILLHSTAAGKAILFTLPYDEFIAYLQVCPLEGRTDNTITDPGEIRRQREEFEQRGYSEEVQENEIDIRCVAASIRDNKGYPIGALSITCPIYLCSDARSAELGKLLSEIVPRLSGEFGYKAGTVLSRK